MIEEELETFHAMIYIGGISTLVVRTIAPYLDKIGTEQKFILFNYQYFKGDAQKVSKRLSIEEAQIQQEAEKFRRYVTQNYALIQGELKNLERRIQQHRQEDYPIFRDYIESFKVFLLH